MKCDKHTSMASKGLKVTQLQWGCVTTSDGASYKDVIVAHQSENWDWVVFGLRHDPGYSADVLRRIRAYMVANTSPTFRASRPRIYLSTGIDQKIMVPIPKGDEQFIYLQSTECVAAYNADVKAGRSAIIFLHSTC